MKAEAYVRISGRNFMKAAIATEMVMGSYLMVQGLTGTTLSVGSTLASGGVLAPAAVPAIAVSGSAVGVGSLMIADSTRMMKNADQLDKVKVPENTLKGTKNEKGKSLTPKNFFGSKT